MTTSRRFETTQAGEPQINLLRLRTVNGDELDLTPLLLRLNIYEDMFSPVMTGDITIADTNNFFNLLPITGNEQITVAIASFKYDDPDPVNFIHRTFDVVKITDIVQPTDYTKAYTLHFVSTEMKRNESVRFSKGYIDTTTSNVVARLMTEAYDIEDPAGLGYPQTNYSGIGRNFKSPYIFSDSIEAWYKKEDGPSGDDNTELFVEKTKYTEPFISFPYMKPFDVINWLASRSLRYAAGRNASRNDNNAANFVFFENKRGFQFTAIDTLLEAKDFNFTRFKYGNTAQNTTETEGHRTVFLERISKLQIQNCFDIIDNIRNGMYSSRLYTYDLSSGQVTEHDYNYIEEFENTESTERTGLRNSDFPLIKHDDTDLSQRFLAKRMFAIQSPAKDLDNITSEETERHSSGKLTSGFEEYLQQRVSQLQRLNNYRVMFEIQANSRHKVGDVVEIDLKDWIIQEGMSRDKDFVEESSKYYSGNYLITSIKHSLTKFDYVMNVEAVKDAFKTKVGQ